MFEAVLILKVAHLSSHVMENIPETKNLNIFPSKLSLWLLESGSFCRPNASTLIHKQYMYNNKQASLGTSYISGPVPGMTSASPYHTLWAGDLCLVLQREKLGLER